MAILSGKQWGMLALGVLGASMIVGVSAASTSTARTVLSIGESASCGRPGTAPCPLQAFMRARIATPLASNDTAKLAAGLERAARLAPDRSWASWSAFAQQGAAAARSGDTAAARAACQHCHETWRDAYRAKYRSRPLPQ